MWSSAEYRKVAESFLSEGYGVVLVGASSEALVCSEVAAGLMLENLCGRTTVGELLALISGAKLVICNDSLVLHIASAFKIPTVAVFCATSPVFGFGPWKNRAVVVEKQGLRCKPCRRHGGRRCPTGTEACMRDLPAEKVLAAARVLLS